MTSNNGHKPRTQPNEYDACVARANAAQFEVAMMRDDIFGIKDALQGEADLLAQICEYRKAIAATRGE